VSVTEQLVIHAQEFNVRIDQIEKLAILNHSELLDIVLDLIDKINVLEVRVKEIHANEMA
tara:strand:- start:290 stop:469 length:180 start_codon:yes stop_codon:yes gene_type:complete